MWSYRYQSSVLSSRGVHVFSAGSGGPDSQMMFYWVQGFVCWRVNAAAVLTFILKSTSVAVKPMKIKKNIHQQQPLQQHKWVSVSNAGLSYMILHYLTFKSNYNSKQLKMAIFSWDLRDKILYCIFENFGACMNKQLSDVCSIESCGSQLLRFYPPIFMRILDYRIKNAGWKRQDAH